MNNEELTADIKQLRVEINRAIAHAMAIRREFLMAANGNAALAFSSVPKSLIEARMWAGETLGEIGHKLPEEYRDEAK